jgi:hypothetical protein
LPPAVERTVAEQSKDATIGGFSTEMDKGKRLYEVALKVNGHGKDISMDADGSIIEVEEEVSMDSLPAEVKAGLMQAAGTGTIGKVDHLQRRDNWSHTKQLSRRAKRHEIQVGPDGKKLAHQNSFKTQDIELIEQKFS